MCLMHLTQMHERARHLLTNAWARTTLINPLRLISVVLAHAFALGALRRHCFVEILYNYDKFKLLQFQSPVFIPYTCFLCRFIFVFMFEPNPCLVILILQFAYRNILSKLERLPHNWLAYCTYIIHKTIPQITSVI